MLIGFPITADLSTGAMVSDFVVAGRASCWCLRESYGTSVASVFVLGGLLGDSYNRIV
jgi:hypothetical protein